MFPKMDVWKMKPRRLLLEISADFEKDMYEMNFPKKATETNPWLGDKRP